MIAVFASGSGTNAEQLILHFRESDTPVSLVVCNKPDAGVLVRAERLGVPVELVDRSSFGESRKILSVLEQAGIRWIALAGFLWLIPSWLIAAYPRRIVNIHPALLPSFGGKGMYGMRVHRAVREQGVRETGISIHYVNEHYDEGEIICRAVCPVFSRDTAEDIADRVHELEYKHYPRVLERLIRKENLETPPL